MEKYKITFLICCHESKDSVRDTIENIKKFNENVCIIINDGSSEDMSELSGTDVHVIKREFSSFVRFDSMVPLHIQMYEYMAQHNIKSDYVVMLATNQLIVRENLINFISDYDASYYARNVDIGCIRDLNKNNLFVKYYYNLGENAFKFQSNHDGMFFKYNIFCDMMEYFMELKNIKMIHHTEEFFYPAYLIAIGAKLVEFSKYNYWQQNWETRPLTETVTVEEVQQCINNGFYIVKRVSRGEDNTVRNFVRSL